MPKIFISYRREDSEHVAGRIYDRLAPHFGRDNVFLDIDAIPFGVDFREYLDQAVGQCDVLLAIIGKQWLDIRHKEGLRGGTRRLDDPADFVRIEILSALIRKIPVIPVLVGRATMPGEQDLPEQLRGLAYRNAAEVRSGRDFHDHINRLIRGVEYVVRQVQGGTVQPATNQQPVEAHPALAREFTNSIGMKFMLIPAGTFLMGSPEDEQDRGKDEGPQHELEIPRPFYMGMYQVTQEEYQRLLGDNPSWFCESSEGAQKVKSLDTRRHPVECISWNDAVAFCRKLSDQSEEKKKGRVYRLPTEAEWEYACRGGAKSSIPFYLGDSLSSTQANFDGNHPYNAAKGPYRERTTPVGSYKPNAWGLFDMHGNVWEWCQDWYEQNYYNQSPRQDPQGPQNGTRRVLRGGSWGSNGRNCRSAYRGGDAPGYRDYVIGFRLVCVASSTP